MFAVRARQRPTDATQAPHMVGDPLTIGALVADRHLWRGPHSPNDPPAVGVRMVGWIWKYRAGGSESVGGRIHPIA